LEPQKILFGGSKEMQKEGFFHSLLDDPRPAFDRRAVARVAGLSEKSMANYDSAKKGPKGRFRMGRRVFYPKAALVEWLESRSTVIE